MGVLRAFIMANSQDVTETEDLQHDKLEPIAIVGFSFKYPQEATSSKSFWEMLKQGRCASTDFPSDRLSVKAFYHPNYNRHDSVSISFPSSYYSSLIVTL